MANPNDKECSELPPGFEKTGKTKSIDDVIGEIDEALRNNE